MTQDELDLVIFIYIGIGAILHFLTAVKVLFPRNSVVVDSLADFGFIFGIVWIVLVVTWPIWIVVLTIMCFSTRK